MPSSLDNDYFTAIQRALPMHSSVIKNVNQIHRLTAWINRYTNNNQSFLNKPIVKIKPVF